MAKTRQSSHRTSTHKMRTRSQGQGPTPNLPPKTKSRHSQPRAPRSKPSHASCARTSMGHRNGPPKGYAYVGDSPTTVAARYALSRTAVQSLMRAYMGYSEAERNELDWKWMSGEFVWLGEEESPDDSIEVEVKVPESLEFLEWPKALGLERMVIGAEMTAEDMDGDSDSGLSEHSDSEFVGVDL
ncbi:hypothetical protein BDD12DRAFT_934730 [Trichophaea hybrida]|nr:hypothetical protein BDD12DRAFT_934730 [Trichophaea hybrida]